LAAIQPLLASDGGNLFDWSRILKPILFASAAALTLAACTTTNTTSADLAVPAIQEAPVMAEAQPAAVATPASVNPLLANWSGPYAGVPPFADVTPEMSPGAIQAGIDAPAREYQAIINNPEAPTFQNTIEAGERAGQLLGRVLAVFGVMTGNMTNPQYQALQREWGPKLSAASDAIVLDPRLFQRVKAVYDAAHTSNLSTEQQRVVTRLYESMVRRGAT
jgi:peptidyl-dipeptidase Dcp